ncbi:MAG: ribulose-phosphate 3-epimerase [Candidatus Dependentiae bacterium]
MFEIWPSLISADLLNLQKTIQELDNHCHGYHLDIMDNHFVPNLTWGAQFMNAIAQNTKKPLWIHLMIEQPENFLDTLSVPEGTYITFHVETKSNIETLIKEIKNRKWKPSIAINPKTSIANAFPYLDEIDQIVLMSVEPGFSGQSFIPEVLKKITPLKHEIKKRDVSINIGMDGGINRNNIIEIANLGVGQFGIASGIFSYPNPVQELEYLYQLYAKEKGTL